MDKKELAQQVSLEKAMFGGYSVESVDRKIDQLLDEISRLTDQNEVMEQKLGILATKIEEYQQIESSIKDSIVNAQVLATNIEQDAQKKAEKIIADANALSDSVMTSAKDVAESKIAEYKALARAEEDKFKAIKEETSRFLSDITFQYKNQLTVLQNFREWNALPDMAESAEPMPEQAEEAPLPQEEAFDQAAAKAEPFYDDMAEEETADNFEADTINISVSNIAKAIRNEMPVPEEAIEEEAVPVGVAVAGDEILSGEIDILSDDAASDSGNTFSLDHTAQEELQTEIKDSIAQMLSGNITDIQDEE